LTVTIERAKKDFGELAHTVSRTSQRVKVRGMNPSVYIISQAQIDGIIATAELSTIPGMVESLKKARHAPREEYVSYEDLNWDAV